MSTLAEEVPENSKEITEITTLGAEILLQEFMVGDENAQVTLPNTIMAQVTTITWEEVEITLNPEESTEPQEKEWSSTTLVEDVELEMTWSANEFSTEKEASFIYTATLVDGDYTFGEGVMLPEITVNVKPVQEQEEEQEQAEEQEDALKAGESNATNSQLVKESLGEPTVEEAAPLSDLAVAETTPLSDPAVAEAAPSSDLAVAEATPLSDPLAAYGTVHEVGSLAQFATVVEAVLTSTEKKHVISLTASIPDLLNFSKPLVGKEITLIGNGHSVYVKNRIIGHPTEKTIINFGHPDDPNNQLIFDAKGVSHSETPFVISGKNITINSYPGFQIRNYKVENLSKPVSLIEVKDGAKVSINGGNLAGNDLEVSDKDISKSAILLVEKANLNINGGIIDTNPNNVYNGYVLSVWGGSNVNITKMDVNGELQHDDSYGKHIDGIYFNGVLDTNNNKTTPTVFNMSNSTLRGFRSGQGAALYMSSGKATFNNVTFKDNVILGGRGSAILQDPGTHLVLDDCRITGNRNMPAITAAGAQLELLGTTSITGNTGGIDFGLGKYPAHSPLKKQQLIIEDTVVVKDNVFNHEAYDIGVLTEEYTDSAADGWNRFADYIIIKTTKDSSAKADEPQVGIRFVSRDGNPLDEHVYFGVEGTDGTVEQSEINKYFFSNHPDIFIARNTAGDRLYLDKLTVDFEINSSNLPSSHGATIPVIPDQVLHNYSEVTEPTGMADITVGSDTYKFNGWYSDSHYQTKWDFSTNLTGETNLTLYARYEEPIKYTVGFDAKDGSPTPDSQTVVSGGKATVPVTPPTKTGYTFRGWYRSANAGETLESAEYDFNTAVTENFILYAKWEPIGYTVRFDKNHAAATGTMTDQAFEYGVAQNLTKNEFERSGYGFIGWNTSKDATTAEYTDTESVIDLTHENGGVVTLYAIWSADADTGYTVIHEQEDLTGGGYTEVDRQNLTGTTGEEVTPPVNTYTGFTSPATQTKTIEPGDSMKIIYRYNRIRYNVSFDSKGGNYTPASQTVLYGGTASEPGTQPTKRGYIFEGWYTSADAGETLSDTVYNFETVVTTNMILYAKWKPIGYTVKYDGNGATSGSVADQAFQFDVEQYLNRNTFVKAGFVFQGWDTNISADYVDFTDEERVKNLTDIANGIVTLYAVWEPGTATGYTVIHEKENLIGAGYTVVDTQNLTGTTGEEVTPPVNTYEGFTSPATQTRTIEADGSMKITYRYNRIRHNVRFDAKGGSPTPTTQTVLFGGTATEPETAPTKTGYTFDGWHTSADAGNTLSHVNYNFDTEVTEDITLYAKWTPIGYEVAFDKNHSDDTGTGTMTNQVFEYDVEQNLKHNEFQRDGYVFKGWNKDKDVSTVEYTDTERVLNLTDDAGKTITLYAIWEAGEATKYTVIHEQENLVGVGYTEVDRQELAGTTGESVTPPVNTYTGFTSPATQTKTIEADGSMKITYQYNRIQYTVDFNAKGGNPTPGSQTVLYGGTATEPATAPTKKGYTFDGWHTSADAGYTLSHVNYNFDTVVTENITLYAKWTPIGYEVAFNGNHVDATGTMTNQAFEYGAAQNLKNNEFERIGYGFIGWNTDENATTAKYTDTQSVIDLTDEEGGVVTLYAIWVAKPDTKYTVIHEREEVTGGTYIEVEREELTGKTGDEVTPAVKTYTGFTSPGTQTKIIAPDGSMTIIYKYNRIRYNISFDAKGGEPTPDSQTVLFGGTATEPGIAPTKTGYTFDGWHTSTDGGTTLSYVNYDFATEVTEDLILYAKWTPIGYEVAFDGNGADSGTMTNQAFEYDVAQNLKQNAFERVGYVFKGWNTDKTATTVEYTDTASVMNLTDEAGGIVTLYAIWTPGTATAYTVIHEQEDVTGGTYTEVDRQNLLGTTGESVTPPVNAYKGFTAPETQTGTILADGSLVITYQYDRIKYNVEFDAQGGDPTPEKQVIPFEGKVTEPTVPTKPGYDFEGWFTSTDGGKTLSSTAYNFDQVVTEDFILYAKWTKTTVKPEIDVPNTKAPQTGDETNSLIWIMLSVLSLLSIVFLKLKRRKS